MIAMAKSLGLGVIAEGVENDASNSNSCARPDAMSYQGYYLSVPLPAAQLEVFLRER